MASLLLFEALLLSKWLLLIIYDAHLKLPNFMYNVICTTNAAITTNAAAAIVVANTISNKENSRLEI